MAEPTLDARRIPKRAVDLRSARVNPTATRRRERSQTTGAGPMAEAPVREMEKASPAALLLAAQRQVGNQAVLRHLAVGQPAALLALGRQPAVGNRAVQRRLRRRTDLEELAGDGFKPTAAARAEPARPAVTRRPELITPPGIGHPPVQRLCPQCEQELRRSPKPRLDRLCPECREHLQRTGLTGTAPIRQRSPAEQNAPDREATSLDVAPASVDQAFASTLSLPLQIQREVHVEGEQVLPRTRVVRDDKNPRRLLLFYGDDVVATLEVRGKAATVDAIQVRDRTGARNQGGKIDTIDVDVVHPPGVTFTLEPSRPGLAKTKQRFGIRDVNVKPVEAKPPYGTDELQLWPPTHELGTMRQRRPLNERERAELERARAEERAREIDRTAQTREAEGTYHMLKAVLSSSEKTYRDLHHLGIASFLGLVPLPPHTDWIKVQNEVNKELFLAKKFLDWRSPAQARFHLRRADAALLAWDAKIRAAMRRGAENIKTAERVTAKVGQVAKTVGKKTANLIPGPLGKFLSFLYEAAEVVTEPEPQSVEESLDRASDRLESLRDAMSSDASPKRSKKDSDKTAGKGRGGTEATTAPAKGGRTVRREGRVVHPHTGEVHEIKVMSDGTIIRCSPRCLEIATSVRERSAFLRRAREPADPIRAPATQLTERAKQISQEAKELQAMTKPEQAAERAAKEKKLEARAEQVELEMAELEATALKRGITRGGQRYFAEANLTGSGKHGINWTEGHARAIKDKKPQGQFNSINDIEYAVQRGADIGIGQQRIFPLPSGHTCIVHMPDGTAKPATQLYVKVYPSGKVHAYPL